MHAALLMLGCLVIGQAEGASDEQLQLSVRRLVQRLDADQLATREQAERELIELGPKVLDLLPDLDERTSAERRLRLERVRVKLQQQAAEDAAGPSKITLHLKQAPLDKVLEAITRQSGNKIVDYRAERGQPAEARLLDVDLDQVDFWPALDSVLDQAELSIYPYGPEKAIYVVAREEGELPRGKNVAYAGPLRVAPVEVTARRNLRRREGGILLLTLELSWEPRINPIVLKQRLADVRVVDEHGNSLLPEEAAEGELEVAAGDETMATTMQLPLLPASRDSQKIASIEATLTALLPGKLETFTFDDLAEAEGKKQRIAGVTVELERVRKNNDLYQVFAQIAFDQASGALESHRGWIFNNEAYLLNPAGEKVPYDVMETYRQTANDVGISYGFVLDGAPKGYKFVYRTPGILVSKGYPYELKDIPLP